MGKLNGEAGTRRGAAMNGEASRKGETGIV